MAKAAKNPGVWGIDLGQCALKAIRLEEADGEIKATAFDYVEHPKILSQPDADPDELTREALEKFLSRNDIKGDLISISVPGQSGLARFVKLPPVDEKKIPDIVRFEAKQQIPFPLEEVVWGFQRLGTGTKTDKMVLDAEVGIFAMKRDMIARSLQHFKEVNIEVHYIQMAPLALCNFLAHDRLGKGSAPPADDDEQAEEPKCVVGLDIGTDNSNLVITDGEKIIWQRPIPLGGNHFTRALTKDLKLTFAKAEHLKRNAVKSPDLKKILASLKPVLNDFVSEVQRSLGYFTNTHRDATIQYMLGLGNAFRLPGLQKYLQEKLQLEVRKLQKIERLTGDDEVTDAPQFRENVLSFGVAHGLALQGLNATRIHTNLLPPEIASERAIRAKKPWAVAAAAVLLLLCPPLMFGWSAAIRAWKNDGVKSSMDKLTSAFNNANKDVSAFQTAELNAQQSRKKLLGLAGGINERLNWIHLNNFVNAAVPRPDGSRLVETARSGAHPREDYFGESEDTPATGKYAYKRWRDQDQRMDEEIKKYLVQVNIEGVSALYSENLSTECFVRLTSLTMDGMNEAEKENIKGRKSLPKSGWIVEIRGYTYHHRQFDFILNTFVENLVALSDPVDAKNRKLQAPDLHPESEGVLRELEKTGQIKPLVSHVFVYATWQDPNPRPGSLILASKNTTAQKILMMYGDPPQFGVLVAGGSKLPEQQDKDKDKDKPPPPPARSFWRPTLGTMSADTFGIKLQTGGGLPIPKGPPKGPLQPTPPGPGGAPVSPTISAARMEFAILFIWQEPLTAEK